MGDRGPRPWTRAERLWLVAVVVGLVGVLAWGLWDARLAVIVTHATASYFQ
jgi:predicted negative regulator of RcsB-dependent stress response